MSRIFGKHKGKKTALKVFSYFFFIFHGFILFADLCLLAATCYFVQKLNGTLPVNNLTELSDATVKLAGVVKALMVSLVAVQVIIIIIHLSFVIINPSSLITYFFRTFFSNFGF